MVSMQTAWGPLPVSDAHVHFFSHGFFSLLAKQKEGLTLDTIGHALDWRMPPEQPEDLATEWLRELDAHGVEKAVLIASLPGDETSVARAVAAHPQRFYGYFFVNPLAPGAAERVERAISSGLHAPCLFPAMHHYSLHNTAVFAVLDAVAKRPRPVVFIHCGVLSVGLRKKLGLPSLFDMRFSNPIDVHALALRYPGIRFVIPHFGAGYFREALMVCDLCPNVFLDTSSTNAWTKYHAPALDLEQVFRRALDVAGPRRLLFGTDSSFFPRGWHKAVFAEQAKTLEIIGISAPDVRGIFHGNLASLLD
jgi:predicted TIM-barrel fold metal-dependent hydrolase